MIVHGKTVVQREHHRVGKTRRDHKSGAWQRCIANKQARADWQNGHKHEQGLADFPWKTCNGKRNKVYNSEEKIILRRI